MTLYIYVKGKPSRKLHQALIVSHYPVRTYLCVKLLKIYWLLFILYSLGVIYQISDTIPLCVREYLTPVYRL